MWGVPKLQQLLNSKLNLTHLWILALASQPAYKGSLKKTIWEKVPIIEWVQDRKTKLLMFLSIKIFSGKISMTNFTFLSAKMLGGWVGPLRIWDFPLKFGFPLKPDGWTRM